MTNEAKDAKDRFTYSEKGGVPLAVLPWSNISAYLNELITRGKSETVT